MYSLAAKAESREIRPWLLIDTMSNLPASRAGRSFSGTTLYKLRPSTRMMGQVPGSSMSRTALSSSLWKVLMTGSVPRACSVAQSRHGSIALLFVHREQRKPCFAWSRSDMLPR